ncbi:hypothetical protein [Chloroflexus aggregans]|uniref:DUF4878 domain-containing protein n=1 Tax=Chloroflexus aggregans (strain MD-66 / DSM 9485) TaxID=326427 RepID=B8GB31_CHLAD|nr:hypothetical protein [Chloroflexus aggregans]ACL26631.1 conserved hypothetical protein [Chloroflexus aggregans DSM 9485]
MDAEPSPVQQQSIVRQPRLPVALLIGGILLILFGVLTIIGISGWQLFNRVVNTPAEIKQTIIAYIEAGRQNDPEAARALFSSAVQRELTRSDLEQSFANRTRFREVADVSFSTFNLRSTLEETRAEITGQIHYTDGTEQHFAALLRIENDQWRLIWIDLR